MSLMGPNGMHGVNSPELFMAAYIRGSVRPKSRSMAGKQLTRYVVLLRRLR